MSQQLIPVNGGVTPEIKTSLSPSRLQVLSSQYIDAKGLQSRATEWTAGGRPIYRRLPATSETYQINFFNTVTESNILGNTFVSRDIEKVGYVFIPYGDSINGNTSLEVVSSESTQALIIRPGVIIWEYGKTEVPPTIVDLRTVDVRSGNYDIAYQLVYDDAPVPKLYAVEDFSLSGFPLTLTSSTDTIVGWRYPTENAFLGLSDLFWSNEDSFFPSYSQPTSAFVQWGSERGQSYAKVTLRCAPSTAYAGTATLNYVRGATLIPVDTVSVSQDSLGQYFTFSVDAPSFETEWNVTFSAPKVTIQSVAVSGIITLLEPQATPSPRSVLVMYPQGTLPSTVIASDGEEIPATYCRLAQVDIGNNFNVLDIEDTRTIIHRDYTPVADWLTLPFDRDLINLYDQVSNYSTLWMAPDTCLLQEYASLTGDQITVEAQ